MKRFTVLLAALVALATFTNAQVQTVGTITVSFKRPAVNATAYAPGEVVATATTNKVPLFIPIANLPSTIGEIVSLTGTLDTAGTVYATIIPVTDTTGIGASFPADNAAYVTTSAVGKKKLPKITLTMTGEGSGIATGDTVFSAIPFNVTGSAGLGFIVKVGAAHTPKAGGEYSFRFGFKFYKRQ